MGIFIAGLVIFLGIHTVSIVAPQWREGQVARLGEGPWKGLYAGIAAVGLGLLIYGFGIARQHPLVLYTPPTALRHLALLLMVPVFPLLVAAYFPGRIQAAAKHPMLLATKLWATAHLLANGWTDVVALDEVPEGGIVERKVDRRSVLLSRRGGAVSCFDTSCAHLGMPLEMGEVDAGDITCAYHGFRYLLETGECLTAPEVQLKVHAVRVIGARVQVRLDT